MSWIKNYCYLVILKLKDCFIFRKTNKNLKNIYNILGYKYHFTLFFAFLNLIAFTLKEIKPCLRLLATFYLQDFFLV